MLHRIDPVGIVIPDILNIQGKPGLPAVPSIIRIGIRAIRTHKKWRIIITIRAEGRIHTYSDMDPRPDIIYTAMPDGAPSMSPLRRGS
jgi:hypothetical protein